MENGFRNKVNQAAKWSSVTEIASKLITPLTNAILARLLAPEVFGVVATLTLVVSFAELFTDAGFQKYLVQHEFEDREDLDLSADVAFWTNLIISLLLWGVIAVFAKPIAALVGSHGYESAIVVMSAQIPLLAFSSIQMARYRREFDFKNLFVARMAVALVPLVVTVPAAFVFRSYWAIVVGTLSRDILNAVILTVRSKWKPKFRYSLDKLSQMLSFSLWTLLENVTIWLTTNIGVFILSISLTPHYLGMFKTSISTGNAYMGIITAATTPVLFSALSRCQSDRRQFQEVLFRFQRMVALLVFPLGMGAYVYREFVTRLLLGNQWMETADFLGLWFLTSSMTIVFSNYNSEVFRSLGKPKLSILVQVLHLAVLIPVLLWGMNQPYSVMTTARALVRLEIIVVSAIILQLVIGVRFLSIVKNVWPSLLSSVLMAMAGMFLECLSDNPIWQVASILICVGIYAVVMLIVPAGKKQISEISVLKKILRIQ